MPDQVGWTGARASAFITGSRESICPGWVSNKSLFAEDHGTMEANPVGPWPFETLVVIFGGNGAWTGATGELVAIGALDTNAGITEGEYAGLVCL